MAPSRVSPPVTPSRDTANGIHTTKLSSPSPIMRSPFGLQKSNSLSARSQYTEFGGAADSTSLYYIRNTVQSLEKKGAAELGFGVFESISKTTFIQLVEYIANERLSSLPHRGSTWDNVLIRALYFAERQHGFEKMIKSFGSEDQAAANLAYGYCKLLLELGNENAAALDTAFGVLYKHALAVAALQHRLEVIQITPLIREELCLMYGDLLTLTSYVATRFYKVSQGVAAAGASVDIYDICGEVIESFRERQEKVIDLIWTHEAQVDGFDMSKGTSAKALRAWLVSLDPVQTRLTQDHTVQLAGQAEFTCLWFQKSLSQFASSDSKVMAITGAQGSGKSVLAASIVERLQRTLGRKPYSTLYYAISGDIPAATTSIAILKSLLAQLLNLRIGDMATYRAVAKAYEYCYASADLKDYEEHLWGALDASFKKPITTGRDTVVVVDGLDEIHGGKAAAQAFFERLAETTCDGKQIKLIGLAESLSMPSGINTTHMQVTRDSVQEDIHSVTLSILAHSPHLRSKQGFEQEQILDRIARTANGSFVWAVLVSQLLVENKTADEFHKAAEEFERQKPSVSDLVHRTLSRHELHTTAKTVIGWLMSAERPLTAHDLRELFAHGSKPEPDIDINAALQPLAPILTADENIKRFRHRSILTSVSTLVSSGKITIPAETRQSDIIIRGLRYAKTVLRDDPPPTLEEYDFATAERSFREHALLAYVVRYWAVHLHRLGGNLPKELHTVLPATTLMPIHERIIWNHELPLVQTTELYHFSWDFRNKNLKAPSAAVLQSILNMAILYERLGKTTEAVSWYYSATNLSHQLQVDMLSTELSHHFLHISESMTNTKRTEIMTHREEVYVILIALLVKEYGASSSEVISMRTVLAQFYEHIHEQSKATEMYEVIHQAVAHVHGHDSHQARGISDHLKVKLGRTKTEEKIETRKSLFDETDETEVIHDLDLATVTQRLKSAKTELDFVTLWQMVSSIASKSTATEWHEKNIEVASAYSRFLASQKRTAEAAAVMTSTTREYESHQASFSDTVVTRLSESAHWLRELGQYTAALSILTATALFYESTKRESSQRTEIHRQISSVESELAESSSSISHGDILERVFRNAIKDKTKPVDARLVTIAKTLAVQNIEQHRLEHAIELIELYLSRAWPAFLSATVNEVGMATIFPKETIELILEFLVPSYDKLRYTSRQERALSALFFAALTAKTVDFALVNRVQALLLEFYDLHHDSDKAIATLQRSLSVRRTQLGTTADDTIKTLYELGRRSHQRPRTYPGWIDFYQQIVTYLNKDSPTCKPKAMDALIIVATTYWEDSRYDDAVYYYKVLWTTFTTETKSHALFSQADFVQTLYERYYTCLERTSARTETLYQVTKQYQSTCVTVFGAESEITTRATLSLARISYASEEYRSESLSLYEQVQKHSSKIAVHVAEIATALTVLYAVETHKSSSSTSSHTLQSATSRSVSSYQTSVSKLGHSHQLSLSQLHEVALLYFKQGKTEQVTKELTTASIEIMTKETSSRKLIEAAESIYATFVATQTVSYLQRFVSELHAQIVCKQTTNAKSWGFDLTKYGRGALPFLAALMVKLSTDIKLSFTLIMANLITEMMYFEGFRHSVKSNESLPAILLAASSLRAFLLRIHRADVVKSLDDEVAGIFVTRDGSKMKLLSDRSARIFMVAIMEYLGSHRNPSFIRAVVLASNSEIHKLMAAEKYAEAYDIANCAFEFALENDGYSGTRGIGYGFALASNLAGIGYAKHCSDANLRKQMLQLSNSIAKKIMDVCKTQGIAFTSIELSELNRLIELLGVQEDYETLAWLLSGLWSSREAHRDWDATTLHNLGRDLIYARYLAGHQVKALRLCEDIAYNLRRTHGASNSITREMNTLLAELYTGIGQHYLADGNKDKTNVDLAHQYFSKALAVHEEMLRAVVHTGGADAADDDDWDTTGAILAEHGISLKNQINGHANADDASVAKNELRLLKFAYQRLGAWPHGNHQTYEQLIHRVQETYPETKEVQTPDKWQIKGYGHGKAESNDGSFAKISNWRLMA